MSIGRVWPRLWPVRGESSVLTKGAGFDGQGAWVGMLRRRWR